MKYSKKPKHINKVRQNFRKSKRKFRKAGGTNLNPMPRR